jgi:AraC-like DNA-binding protein
LGLGTVRLETLTAARNGGPLAIPLRGINKFELVLWITRGNGNITLDGQTRGINTHSLIIIPAETTYDVQLGSNTFGTLVQANQSEPLLNKSTPIVVSIRHIADQAHITSTLESIQAESHCSDQFADIAMRHQYDLLVIAARRMAHLQSQPHEKSAATKLMRNFAELVEANFKDGHSVSYYASKLGVTTAHLSRVCQSENTKSASKYLQDRILLEAKLMLTETDLQISDIAKRLHFSSAAYFSRLFSTKVKTTPKDFRLSIRQSNKRAALARYG